ncbi:unnamed protein product [Rhizoctonia solani]|uniref:Uncharacterized protein n=1 Tax=Rhizoctonia solani TaxID=456999 RepID=A0A8H3AXC9_9AGAM|nr:unnamed protein product [Rhizoctonia solani]
MQTVNNESNSHDGNNVAPAPYSPSPQLQRLRSLIRSSRTDNAEQSPFEAPPFSVHVRTLTDSEREEREAKIKKSLEEAAAASARANEAWRKFLELKEEIARIAKEEAAANTASLSGVHQLQSDNGVVPAKHDDCHQSVQKV